MTLSFDNDLTNMVAIYGPPGVGKTTVAAKLVPNKAILVAGDPGWISLKNLPYLADKIEPRKFEDFETLRTAIKDAMASNGEKAVILDGFSSMVNAMMYFYMMEKLPNGRENKHYFVPKKSPREHPDIPSWDDYHLTKRMWDRVLHGFAQSEVNVIVTLHHNLPSVQSSTEKMYGDTTRPDLPKEVLTLLLKNTSVLGYMERSSSGERTIKVQPSRRLTAKTWIKFPADEVSDTVFVDTIMNYRKGINNG